MTLSNKDASIIKGMCARGDKHHDVAAWFGENQARVAEVLAGSHGEVAIAPAGDLFPKGAPGLKGRRLRGSVKNALTALDAGNTAEAIKQLTDGLNRFNQHES